MDIILPGFTYKQYTEEGSGEQREMIYEVNFQIDIDQIEAITPSTGPAGTPIELPYSRVIGKSGRYYDIRLPFKELQKRIQKAKQEKYYRQLIIIQT